MSADQPFTYLAAFNVALALLGVVAGFALKSLTERLKDVHDDAKALRRDLGELRVHIADRYLPREDHSKALDAIFSALRRIEDKVDRKADAPYRFKPTSDFGALDGVPSGIGDDHLPERRR